MLTELVFVLREKLPLVTEAFISIYNYAPGGSTKKGKESKRRKDAVNVAKTSWKEKLWLTKSKMDWQCISVTFIIAICHHLLYRRPFSINVTP